MVFWYHGSVKISKGIQGALKSESKKSRLCVFSIDKINKAVKLRLTKGNSLMCKKKTISEAFDEAYKEALRSTKSKNVALELAFTIVVESMPNTHENHVEVRNLVQERKND